MNGKKLLLLTVMFLLGFAALGVAQNSTVIGTVTDSTTGQPVIGVNILDQGSSTGTSTEADGTYSLSVQSLSDTLRFSFVGYGTQYIPIGGRHTINLTLASKSLQGKNLVVVGYGTQQEKDITGAVSKVNSKDIAPVQNGGTISEKLAGQIPGVTVRTASGRPGRISNLQIRNQGTPLYVIDGIQADEGEFNELGPNDIKSISVLKGASAAIYGSQAANGVILVTTKSGDFNTPTEVGIDFNTGIQNLSTYPNNVLTSGYDYKRYRAQAELNGSGSTDISPEEIQNWKQGQGLQYESFNWPDFIFHNNAPKRTYNIHASGGGEDVHYYFSYSRLNQNAVFKQYNFKRNNIQINVTGRVAKDLTVGVKMSGRIEQRNRPGVPGYDDYVKPLYASLRNHPTQHPYANNNPKYLKDINHNSDNAALWTYDRTGHWQETYRSIKPNFFAQYDFPIDGLSIRASYGYFYRTQYQTNHEFTYDAYTYDQDNDTYTRTGGSTNPFQERRQNQDERTDAQGRIDYSNSFGKHNISATVATEWFDRNNRGNYFHNVPAVNQLDLIKFNTIKNYDDYLSNFARINFVGRVSYNYNDTYYAQFAGSENGSFRFAPGKRFGFFPSASIGWRITNESFFKNLIGKNSLLSDLKFRASYGNLADDNIGIGDYAYRPGYNYDVAKYIFDGQLISTTATRGVPVTNISWFKSTKFDVGFDFGLFDNKLTGSADYFHRKRTGLLGNRYNVIIPAELGYTLPQQNQNSDAVVGGDASLRYENRTGAFSYSIDGNVTFARHRDLSTFNPAFGNSWDQYRNSIEDRWSSVVWGYNVTGQFQSQEQINNYDVNVDGQGNKTLLPGDLIYKDFNGDGVINEYDVRPIGIGNNNPVFSGGLHFNLGWKGIDFNAGFVYGSMFAHTRDFEAKVPFYSGSNGNLLTNYIDAWHRQDPRDPNSKWISGKYPPLRFNPRNHSDYNKVSTYWTHDVRYLRLRTLQLGYSFPEKWIQKAKLKQARVYVNGQNLFTIDNAAPFQDPTITNTNGLMYPQTRFYSLGVNLTF